MTLILNDPSLWPSINAYRVCSYLIVAASTGMLYDWVLTFGREVELVWRQRWSFMTFLYLSMRYVGITYAVIQLLTSVPTISVSDVGCYGLFVAQNSISVVTNAILDVIMLTRLYAMYQRSRKVLISLIIIWMAVNITDGVIASTTMRHVTGEEAILFGTYQCTFSSSEGNSLLLSSITWVLSTVWEVLALCLAAWIAVKHFRELRGSSTGRVIEDCFTVLMRTHVVYFASVVAVSCFNIGYLSPTLFANLLGGQIYIGVATILQVTQLFVLGPRLILGVREYNAKLVDDSDAGTAMTSIAFEERVHVSTSSSV